MPTEDIYFSYVQNTKDPILEKSLEEGYTFIMSTIKVFSRIFDEKK